MPVRALRTLLVLLLLASLGCPPTRSRSNNNRGGDDDDATTGDDDDATGDDDDATGDDDDATGDDDDATGDPISNPSQIVGRTYAFDLADATWVQPAGMGSLFASFFEGIFSVSVLESSALEDGAIDLRFGALTAEGDQDLCTATSDTQGSWANPWMDAGPTAIAWGGYALQSARFAGRFVDASVVVEGAFSGEMDARLVYELVTETPEELCDLLASFATVVCAACGSDGAPYCWDIEVEDMPAELAFDEVLVGRSAAQIGSDGACN